MLCKPGFEQICIFCLTQALRPPAKKPPRPLRRSLQELLARGDKQETAVPRPYSTGRLLFLESTHVRCSTSTLFSGTWHEQSEPLRECYPQNYNKIWFGCVFYKAKHIWTLFSRDGNIHVFLTLKNRNVWWNFSLSNYLLRVNNSRGFSRMHYIG